MSKLGWFIGGTLTGIAGVLAAAHFLGDDVSDYSSSADGKLEDSQEQVMAFESEGDCSNAEENPESTLDSFLETPNPA